MSRNNSTSEYLSRAKAAIFTELEGSGLESCCDTSKPVKPGKQAGFENRPPISKRALCGFLILSIFALSIPATPASPAWNVKGPESLTAVLLSYFDTLNILGLNSFSPAAPLQETQEYRDSTVASLLLNLPAAVKPGFQLQLAAIPVDSNDVPVSGVELSWEIQSPSNVISNPEPASGALGLVELGEYTVTVSGAGKETQATILVSEEVSDLSNTQMSHGGDQANLLLPVEDWNPGNIEYAQQPRNQRGETPGKPKENSNFNITAPILSVAGRAGFNLDLNLTYNSRVWTKMGSDIAFDMDKDSLAPGWSIGFGKLLNMIDGGIVLFEADGTKRFFSGSVKTTSSQKIFQGQSSDGSFIKATTITDGEVVNGQVCFQAGSTVLKYPDGMTIDYLAFQDPGCRPLTEPRTQLPSRIIDKNGNYLTINYYYNLSANDGRFINNITDSLGRTYVFNYVQLSGKYYLASITGPGLRDLNGQATTRTFVRFNYKDHVLSYNFIGLNPRVPDSNNAVKVLSSIYYPATDTGYWFGNSDSYSSYGMIRKVEEQKGMSFDLSSGSISAGQTTRQRIYSYPDSSGAAINDVPEYTTVTETWDGMPNPSTPAVTTYQVDWNSSPRTTTVVLPYQAGKTTEYSYNYSQLPPGSPDKLKDGITFKTEFYDGNGILRTKDEVEWSSGTDSFNVHNYTATYSLTTLRPSNVKHTEIVNGSSLTKTSVFDLYGPYNRVLEMHELGYNNETLRKTVTQYIDRNDSRSETSYAFNGWSYEYVRVINLPSVVEVFDGGNNRIGRTEFTYDVEPLLKRNAGRNLSTCYSTPPYCAQQERGLLSSITTYSQVTNSTLAGSRQDKREYDMTGNIIVYRPSTLVESKVTTTFTSATAYAYPQSMSSGNDPILITTSSTYDYNTGLPLSVTDANQKTTTFTYELATWRSEKTVSQTGAYTINTYDDLNKAYTQTGYTSGGQIVARNIVRVNGLSLPYREEQLSSIDSQGGETYIVAETEYDERGRRKRTSNPFKSSESAHGVYWSEVFYDSVGRVEKTKSADGSERFHYFDETSRPSVASSALGHTYRMKDPTGREKWYRTDSDGNVAEVVEPDPTGDGSIATNGLLAKYTFDSFGQLLRTEQGTQERKFRYDSLGRLTHQKMAETNATLDDSGAFVGTQGGQWSEFFTYDQMSNISTTKDARGVTTTYSYQNPAVASFDPLNRLFSVAYDTNGAVDVLASPTTKLEYQPTGNISLLKSIYTETGATPQRVVTNDLSYDTFGRVVEKKTTLASRPNFPTTVNYAYDSLGRLTDVTYPAQYGISGSPRKNIHNDFDSVGRLQKMQVDGVDYASDFAFNNFDQVTTVKIGPSGSNQINEQYNYDPQSGNLANQKVLRGGTSLLDLSYQYQHCSCSTGGSGQLTAITDNLNRNKDRAFVYDKLGRLTKVTGGVNQTWSQIYSYDRYGNRLTVQSLGVEALRFENQAANKEKRSNKAASDLLPDSALRTKDSLLKDVNKIADPQTEEKTKVSPLDLGKSVEEDATTSLTTNSTPFDFDGDHKADFSTWRRSAGGAVAQGTWVINNSQTGQNGSSQLGASGYQIVPGDYDGDGKTDKAVWNPSNGLWTIHYSLSGQVGTQSWGLKGDATVPADYDGDGKTDIAVWRPSDGVWYIIRSSDGSYDFSQFGTQLHGDIPSVGDYDGDGKADLTVWRPASGDWYIFIRLSSNGQVLQPHFGLAGDVPVPADYDGDDKTDLAVWRPSNNVWYLHRSSDGGVDIFVLGSDVSRDVLVPADYDGDGKADAAVWTASTGTWTVRKSTTGANSTYQLGSSGDVAVPSAYVRRSSAPNAQNQEIPTDGHTTLAYDVTSNRIVTTGFEYDLAGNQTRVVQKDGSALRFQYDAAGRMVKVKADNGTTIIATYTYGIGRERLITQEGTETSTNLTYYAWESGAVASEYVEGDGATLTWAKNYFYLAGSLLATQTRNGSGENVQFDHADQLGTRLITDPGTGTSFEQSTLPFGTALDSETSGSISQRFTSYDRSASTGLDYAVNRFYDSAQGRFTTVDPIKMDATRMLSPQTLNLYSYVNNDPVNKTDPSGLDGNDSVFSSTPTFPFPVMGGTGASIPGWLSTFLNGVLGNLFGGGSGWYPGMQVGPTMYFWQLNTAAFTASAPPLPGAGTISNVLSNSADFSTNNCLNDVMNFLGNYVRGEGGTLGPDATNLVSSLLNYMQFNQASVVEVTFAIANAYHETENFNKFTEGVSTTSAGYGGGSDYRGRGYVHLTHKANYDSYFISYLGRKPTTFKGWGGRVTKPAYEPSEASDVQTALGIMSWYFRTNGTYGFLNKRDYLQARRTINPKEGLGKHVWRGGPTIRQRITGLTNGLEPILRGC